MANRAHPICPYERGFTLLETLVALSVTAILLATLIPISRNTLFRIAKIDGEHRVLSIVENLRLSNGQAFEKGTSIHDNVQLHITKRALPLFGYDKSTPEQWQPHLVTIEARDASGATLRIETIRLERVAP